MTDQPPVPPRGGERNPIDDPAPMPRWVPIAIGVVLVTLAALAVLTERAPDSRLRSPQRQIEHAREAGVALPVALLVAAAIATPALLAAGVAREEQV